MANTVTFNHHDYTQKMRARIATPTCWKDILNVKYSDVRTIVNSYMSTEPTVATGTRGTAYVYGDFTLTADTLTISTYKVIPIFIDEADRYQQSYVNQMTIADFQGKKISEKIESLFLGQYGETYITDFGLTDLSNTGDDDTTAITVSASNIDDIIRAVKRKLYANNGVDLAVSNGIYFAWRASDFEMLEAKIMDIGLVKLSLIKAKIQQWITHTKQAIAVQVKRLSEKEPNIGYATVWS